MKQVPQGTKGRSLTTVIIVILITIIAFFLLSKPKVSVAPIPEEGVNQEELENLDSMKDQSEISEEDDINTLETELNATSFNELEADLEAFDF